MSVVLFKYSFKFFIFLFHKGYRIVNVRSLKQDRSLDSSGTLRKFCNLIIHSFSHVQSWVNNRTVLIML